MRTDDDNPYRASALAAEPAEPLEPLPPLPPETPAQRSGKWFIALGLAIGIYGGSLAAIVSAVLAVSALVLGVAMVVVGIGMCRPAPIRVEQVD